MKITTKITGMPELQKELRRMSTQAAKGSKEGAVTGFTQRYAVYVHERQARHKEGKQWKYLESPWRTLLATGELLRVIKTTFERTKNLTMSLVTAGLRIQRHAQDIVPVDTGALKASAFTCKESDLDRTANESFRKSEAIRQRELKKRSGS